VKRRAFLRLLSGAAVASPFVARAQQAMPVVGFLNGASAAQYADRVRAFHAGLVEAGYAEGRNVATEYRWADGENDRLSAMAAELVNIGVAVIVAGGGAAARAAKASTTTIPVVFTTAADPVESGLVVSLNRPSGNLTGATNLNQELGPKRIELLHEMIPNARAFALLDNLANPDQAKAEVSLLEAAATSRGLQLHVLHASAEQEFERTFTTLAQLRADALTIGSDAFLNSRAEQLAILSGRHGVPAIQNSREFAVAGGLMSYGGRGSDAYRIAGTYAGRILKGERPGDMPVQQATKVDLVINLKTAKALGISVPLPLIGRADEVIE
jgi:putative ABC transport system substrate-binding protein